MITTAAPAWLRRSDQAVTWARTMLTPRTDTDGYAPLLWRLEGG